MARTVTLLLILCLVVIPLRAFAQDDPFLSDMEDGTFPEQLTGNTPEHDEAQTFSGPMEKLLDLAGENKEKSAATDRSWENPKKGRSSGKNIKYDASFEMKMREEIAQPFSDRERMDRLEELQRDLKDSKHRRDEKAQEEYFRGSR